MALDIVNRAPKTQHLLIFALQISFCLTIIKPVDMFFTKNDVTSSTSDSIANTEEKTALFLEHKIKKQAVVERYASGRKNIERSNQQRTRPFAVRLISDGTDGGDRFNLLHSLPSVSNGVTASFERQFRKLLKNARGCSVSCENEASKTTEKNTKERSRKSSTKVKEFSRSYFSYNSWINEESLSSFDRFKRRKTPSTKPNAGKDLKRRTSRKKKDLRRIRNFPASVGKTGKIFKGHEINFEPLNLESTRKNSNKIKRETSRTEKVTSRRRLAHETAFDNLVGRFPGMDDVNLDLTGRTASRQEVYVRSSLLSEDRQYQLKMLPKNKVVGLTLEPFSQHR